MVDILTFIGGMLGTLLLWTFCIYWIHRIGHIQHPKNIFWDIHKAHHQIPYFDKEKQYMPDPGQWFWWLGDWRTSLDVFISMTTPLLVITYFWPQYGVWWLIFHYFYEIFLSEDVLDHNVDCKGWYTRYMAWGDAHLYHHINLYKNYAIITNLWDYVFGTFEVPPEDFPEKIIANRKKAKTLRSLEEAQA